MATDHGDRSVRSAENGFEILTLEPGDEAVLADVEADVFDGPLDAGLVAEFLRDPRHHIAVARHSGRVIGFASGVHYVHPDKPAELWVNEVGVAPAYQGKGVGKRLLAALFAAARHAGCTQAWVLTDKSNGAARRLYRSLGGREAPGATVMFDFRIEDEG